MSHHQDNAAWPAHATEIRAWSQTTRAGTRADRTLAEIEFSLPPAIAHLPIPLDGPLAANLEAATREIVALDNTHGPVLAPLAALLLRTESIASSKIEDLEASTADYARATYGAKSNSSATAMVNATKAMTAMIDSVDQMGAISAEQITTAHALLMADDPYEASLAGRWRQVQNWIGGSDHAPRATLYVPPPADRVADLMDDLVAFANRDDIPTLAQAAIAHAQFESIHPFNDGNGRIGRALINAILRRRRVTTSIVVPLASALVAHRDRYFDHLNAYRTGDITPIIVGLARAAEIAAVEAQTTARRLAAIPSEWHDAVGQVRAGSPTAQLLDLLTTQPVLSTSTAVDLLGGSQSSMYDAVARLHQAGVLRPLTDRKRDQIWGAGAILDELDDLAARIGHAAR